MILTAEQKEEEERSSGAAGARVRARTARARGEGMRAYAFTRQAAVSSRRRRRRTARARLSAGTEEESMARAAMPRRCFRAIPALEFVRVSHMRTYARATEPRYRWPRAGADGTRPQKAWRFLGAPKYLYYSPFRARRRNIRRQLIGRFAMRASMIAAELAAARLCAEMIECRCWRSGRYIDAPIGAWKLLIFTLRLA